MTVYRGRSITGEEVAFIRRLILDRPELSRWKLSRELCEAWQWKQANGALRDMVCRGLLLMLHRTGEIELPPVRRMVRNRIAERARPARLEMEERPLHGSLGDLVPVEFAQVRRSPEESLFNSLLDQHHYLGYERPVGEHLKYLVKASGQVAHARITFHIVDFSRLSPLPPVDEVYLALGTTIKVAGSQAAFRAVDFDANLAVARAALAAGARRCGLVSAMGADAKSRVFYNRVKGELEEALAQLPFEGLVIARPSLLVGDRAALGQPERPLEKVSAVFMKMFSPLIPANYRAIAAAQVARTLLARTPSAEGRVVVLSGEMQRP